MATVPVLSVVRSLRVVVVVVFVCVSLAKGINPAIAKEELEERECFGTANGFSSSGTSEFRYNLLRKRYLGCTYVLGNLEISHLDDTKIDYDLSFLRHIRYVSGYVLIGLSLEVSAIPLESLEIIRGNHTFSFHGEEYSLMVALTSRQEEGSPAKGLTTLRLPRLKEISRGKAMFIQNPLLGHIDMVNWEPILKGRLEDLRFGKDPYDTLASNQTDPDLCFGGGMWGNDQALCQEVVSTVVCAEGCGSLCYGPEPDQCCHHACAIGCTGPSDSECMYCKDYVWEEHCVGFCPALSYQLMQQCVKYTPLNAS